MIQSIMTAAMNAVLPVLGNLKAPYLMIPPMPVFAQLPAVVATTVEYVVYAVLAGAFVYAIVKAVIAAREKDKGTQGWDGIVAACWMPVAVFLVVGIFALSGISEEIGIELFE